MSNKGFSLLEVLVALVVFAVSFTSIYVLVSQSLSINQSAKERLELILGASEFLAVYWDNLPSSSLEWERYPLNNEVDLYRVERIPVGFFNIEKVYCFFKKGKTTITYVFYQ